MPKDVANSFLTAQDLIMHMTDSSAAELNMFLTAVEALWAVNILGYIINSTRHL